MLRPSLLHTLDWIGAVGAGAGVEVRAPFFDVRLAELCLSLPPTQKLRRGWSRFVMREAMAGILPDEIRRRPDKSNMEHGFNHALRTHARARLGSDLWKGERIARYLDPAVCAELQHRFMTGAEMTEEEGLRFWRSASLALWLAGSDRAYVAHESRGWDDVPALAARGLTREEV
jgi:asparagine synthase (glutamine-hydrolysing)